MANIAQAVAVHCLPRALKEAALGHLNQLRALGRNLPHALGEGAVGLPAVQHQAAVHADDAAFLHFDVLAGDAMHYLVINAYAQRGRVALIAQEGRGGVRMGNQLVRVAVQIQGGHARRHLLAKLA